MRITVFHGSGCEVKQPSLLNARSYTDFGKGFYVTESFELAEIWAVDRHISVVTQYELDTEGLNVLSLELSKDWLDFVLANRNVDTFPLEYDAASGKAVDGAAFAVVEWHEDWFTAAELTLQVLSAINLKSQICLKNKVALGRLRFVTSHTLSDERKKEVKELSKTEWAEMDSIAQDIIREANKASRLPNT